MHTTQVTPGSSTEEHMNIRQDEANTEFSLQPSNTSGIQKSSPHAKSTEFKVFSNVLCVCLKLLMQQEINDGHRLISKFLP